MHINDFLADNDIDVTMMLFDKAAVMVSEKLLDKAIRPVHRIALHKK